MQDISPNNNQQSATNTNTMNPRNLTAQSAGSISPTIISQSNADRRRRAANTREERRQESLAANVEKANAEREYRRYRIAQEEANKKAQSDVEKEYLKLKSAEKEANKKAEERKKQAQSTNLKFWTGGYFIPSENKHVPVEVVSQSVYDFYSGKYFSGASDPFEISNELKQFMGITNYTVDLSSEINSAYQDLNRYVEHINKLYQQEADEKNAFSNAKLIERNEKNAFYNTNVPYTPMSEEAVAAHYRLANDPNTDAETRQRLINDLKRDSEYVATYGGTNLSAAHEKYLSEDIYRGGSSVSKELKQTAGTYLAAAGSTYGKTEANQAQSNVYVNQTEKARDALLQRYQARDEINNPNNTTATTEALRANMAGAAEVLSDLTQSRSRLGLENVEKRGLSAAAEKQFEKQNAKVRAAMKDNPYVAADTALYAESILRVLEGDKVNLSNEAFLREQGLTERRFGGTDWTSAGGESAADAVAKGKDKTSYSMFKSAGEDDAEFILIDSAGKKRYTLKQEDSGAFKIFGWSGDIVASSESAQGLPGALRNLNIPFDEKSFNVFRPDSDSTVVRLADETDISGIGTAAAFKASVLGTFRGNEEIMKVEGERRAAEETAARQTALSNLDAALMDSQGYTLRIMGEPVDMPKTTAARKEEPNILSGAAVMASTMAGALPGVMAAKSAYDLVSNPPKTIFDEWAAEDAVADSSKRVEALTYGGKDGERDVGGLFGSAREYADVVDSLVESGELVAGSKKKSVLLSDEENPENSVYTYTDLEWSEKASKESVEKFFNAESKLKSAGEGLSAAISDYNAKVEKKEKILNDVWWGVPKVARDFTQTYLPEAEKVYPFVNAAELLRSDLRQRITVNEFLKDAVSGNLKYDSPSDFVQKEVYEKDPLFSYYLNYRYLRDEPVNFAAQVGVGYAVPYALFGGAKVVRKTIPYIRGTVVDPLANTQLGQKSGKYVSDLVKSIPPSPVSVRVGSANLVFNADTGAKGTVDSLMFIRRQGNYEKATPIISRVTFDKSGNTRYSFGLNDPAIQPKNLAFGGTPYVLREPDKIAFAEAALKNVGDTKSLERLRLFDLQTKYLQNSDPIVMQNIKPHIAEVLKSKGINNVDAVSNAIVNTMSKYRAYSQSSMTQRAVGKELGDIGLTRTPRDLDLFVETVDKYNDEVTAAINKAAGKDIVFVEDGKVLMKSDRSELFDTHEMGQFDSTSAFAPGGVRMERYYVPGTKIQVTSLQTQFLNKRSGTGVLLPEPRVYSGAGAFDTGGSGIGYLMPAHAGRVKDVADYYIAGRVLANQMKLRGEKYADNFRDVLERSIETYGDDTARQLRSEYESSLKKLQKSGVEMKEFEGEIIPVKDVPYFVRRQSKNLNPINLDEKAFKNQGVEYLVNNANVNTLVGMPVGLYLSAGFVGTAAAKYAEGEEATRDFVSREVVPMLVGGYFGGRGVQTLSRQLAFRGRTNYVPLEKITYKSIIEGNVDFPLWEYYGNEKSKATFLGRYGRGGAAMKRAEDIGITSENAELFAYRGESQIPEEVRPGVSRIRGTKYLDEDKSEVFSGSAASTYSVHFSRALSEEVYGSDLPFGLNVLPKSSNVPHGTIVLGTQKLKDVPHGLGITRTEEIIKKNIPIGQYQAVSGKTARYENIVAEDEITTQPGAEYQVLDKSFRTKWYDKDIAVDVVGLIPKGAKKTDVKISVEPNKFREPTAKEQLENLDLVEELGWSLSAAKSNSISPYLWYPVTKAKIRYAKNLYKQNAKNLNKQNYQKFSKQTETVSDMWDATINEDSARLVDLSLGLNKPDGINVRRAKGDSNNVFLKIPESQSERNVKQNKSGDMSKQLIQKIGSFEKNYLDDIVNLERDRPSISERGRGGNPFTANAFMPDTKQSRQSGFTKLTQATTAERETPRAFTETRKTQSTGTPKGKNSFESVFSKSSPKTTKTSERKATTTGTGVFGLGSSSPIFTSSKSGPSRVTETSSSGSARTTRRSDSSIGRSTSRGTRAKSGSSKSSSSSSSSSSSGLKIFDTPMKRKTPKLRWDKNKDRRKKSYYNVFTVENVDLPILRGEEALTGQTLPKQELPANKKTIYQFGNIFTTKKPREYRKTNKKGFRI